ncbi:MAG: hypothetical protein A2V85_06975 [Chloroflexi bacterium RBG_16_72_14]|nr:MAG: hypothetical protein A2V85_06975 [Chloroflexi bacterium RBG_16_72_14]
MRNVPTDRRVRLLALIAAVALAAVSCGDATGTPSPAAPDTTRPIVTPTPALTLNPTAIPNPTATPRPTEPGPRWETSKLPGSTRPGLPVLLADGRVLLISDNGVSAAVWDPATGEWTATSGLNKARSRFAAIGLADGRVLVAGGINSIGESFSSAYAWDPATGDWTKVGIMTQARTAPSIAALPDGRVLVAGGYFAIEQDWGMVTPPDLAWTGPARTGGAGTATLAAFVPPIADVEVPPYGHGLATAEIFDPATGEWSKARPMRYVRAGAPAVTLADGRVLVAGSTADEITGIDWETYSSGETYDPETGRWSLADETHWIDWDELRELGVPAWVRDVETGGDGLSPGTLVALDDGDAVMIGRSEWAKHQGEETRSFRFDADGGTWREIETPWLAAWENDEPYRTYTSPGPRWLGASAVKLRDGRVLVAGGNNAGMEVEGGTSLAARLYDPATDAWTKLPKVPEPGASGAGILLADGSVMIIVGRSVMRFIPGP